MRELDAELRRLAGELDLPEPVRSRVLLELRGDLEAMAARLEEGGMEAREAWRRAVESLVPTAPAQAELSRVHRPLYRRLVDRFSERQRHRLERLLLWGVSGVYVAGGVSMLARLELLTDPSPFLWPVLGLAVLMGAVGAAALFRLFVMGSAGRATRRLCSALPGLGAVALLVGFAGSVVDLYAVAGRVQADIGAQLPEVLGWLRRDAALLSLALLSASAAGLVWLSAAIRVARIEQAEAEALGFTERREG